METRIYSNVGELLGMLPRLKVVSGPRAGSFLQLRYPFDLVRARRGERLPFRR